ncbi:ethanolamine ammonia-lyase subunit EutC [Bradyrhizobium sp. LHD-71]|uniref:ethanolamine ammonia-lyase subunit EutC n=1 Tax=Bradyrhizobium sp. LHD-71 TaxID=3072141 RepID=UPI00280DDEFF|nr:ethanolamine ammonia-lyase subunit EutC [Bradyrhizobium sp. LHD-71]MDQ8727176.1 ethanolamine ammonia-lyase subunit EutC [Bradyrhizobium sp. LHD-71]
MSRPPHDPWFFLANRTMARIARGRSGASLPTREVLAFDLAHALARDAVHARLDRAKLADALTRLNLRTVDVESQAVERAAYLRQPDAGRRLSEASAARLAAAASGRCDLAIMIGDGLSARAVDAHAAALMSALVPRAAQLKLTVGPVALAEGARVALGDVVGEALGARLCVVLIGERPGLSAADSLGVYLTWDPRPGRTDAERNCISNIRPDGLAPAIAAQKLIWLISAALGRQLTGVALKDESDAALSQATPDQLDQA